MYKITDYTKQRAKELNLIVKPSTFQNKKIDVYDLENNLIARIGDKRYFDYPTYIINDGLDYANKRRKLYFNRHKNDENITGLLSKYLLW